ncbi:phytoene/squalene synthase family protein [Streptomyces sp. CG1]|uniref:phytoene/squalene synthase family protein n=1 Tax=Streptomyces sp. CG1 TaxID=1287523 RepID=UPI0034E22539
MRGWKKSLDAAGVREPGLRADYDRQRQLVRRFRRTAYVAARLLLPGQLLPHVVAMTAVMHHGDNLLDTGPLPQREAAWAGWEQRVREALKTGTSDTPLLRALVHTVAARPRLRETVEAYLETATAELHFTGFATEADYQAYVDAYSFPAFMLVADLLGPQDDDRRYRAACRTFIDGSQRLDFVNDLAEDLREGHVGIPVAALERFSLGAAELAAGRSGAGLDALVADQVSAARASLTAARELPTLIPAPGRRLVRALVEIELLTADAVQARGAGVLRGSVSPPPARALRVLVRRN